MLLRHILSTPWEKQRGFHHLGSLLTVGAQTLLEKYVYRRCVCVCRKQWKIGKQKAVLYFMVAYLPLLVNQCHIGCNIWSWELGRRAWKVEVLFFLWRLVCSPVIRSYSSFSPFGSLLSLSYYYFSILIVPTLSSKP